MLAPTVATVAAWSPYRRSICSPLGGNECSTSASPTRPCAADNNGSALPGTKCRDVHPVGTRRAAVAARSVLGQVDQHVVAVVGVARVQPLEFLLAYDVDECHRGLDRHP